MRASVSARLIGPLLAPSVLGPSFAAMARDELGLKADELDMPDARVDHEVAVRLVELAVQCSGNERFGLHSAAAIDLGFFHVLDYMVRSSRTVREAMERVFRYQRLFHDGLRFRLAEQDGAEVLTIGVQSGLRFRLALAEFCMGCLFVIGYRMGLPATAKAVCFAYPKPNQVRDYERVFRVPVYFEASETHAVFPIGVLDTPLPHADTVLNDLLQRHADRLLARLPQQQLLAEQVRALVARELRGGNPNLQEIAKHLHLSPRTLRRRLAEDGITFHALLDDMRRELALSYLAEPGIALEDAAFFLGYSEASAFRRAFRRWTGHSVAEHRRK